MTRSIEFNENGSRRVRSKPAEMADADDAAARKRDAERQREKNRREFNEHRRLSHETGFVAQAVKKVRGAAKRLVAHAAPLRGKSKKGVRTAGDRHAAGLREAQAQQSTHVTGDDTHVSLALPAVNKAAMAGELYAISRQLTGMMLAGQRAKTAAEQGFTDEQRSLLIAASSYVRRHLPPDMRTVLDILVEQHTDPGFAVSVSDVGKAITASDDPRVRKGGVIGYYRALFQSIADLQKEFMITEATKKLPGRRA